MAGLGISSATKTWTPMTFSTTAPKVERVRCSARIEWEAASAVLARAQTCPGTTYGSVATPGGIENRLGGASGGPGYINASAVNCAPPVAPYATDGSTLFGNSGPGIILGPGDQLGHFPDQDRAHYGAANHATSLRVL